MQRVLSMHPPTQRSYASPRILHGDRPGHPSGLRREDDGFYWMWKERFKGSPVCAAIRKRNVTNRRYVTAVRCGREATSGMRGDIVELEANLSGNSPEIVGRYARFIIANLSRSFCEFIFDIAEERAHSAQRSSYTDALMRSTDTLTVFLRKDAKHERISSRVNQHAWRTTSAL